VELAGTRMPAVPDALRRVARRDCPV